MKAFNNLTKIAFFPAYYLLHKNFILGIFHKYFIKKFFYKNFVFNLSVKDIPLSSYSSFLLKTYEYNDRKLVEKYINFENKCIIIGGGLGFIPTLAYHNSRNKVLVFEINKSIIKNLDRNLHRNKCNYSLYNNNLVLEKNLKDSKYFTGNNFLSTSQYFKKGKLKKVNNIHTSRIKNFNKFNTLIIDGEGVEEYFINKLNKLKNIEYIIFELHNNLFSGKKIQSLFLNLKKKIIFT